jgi:hypothetical protein
MPRSDLSSLAHHGATYRVHLASPSHPRRPTYSVTTWCVPFATWPPWRHIWASPHPDTRMRTRPRNITFASCCRCQPRLSCSMRVCADMTALTLPCQAQRLSGPLPFCLVQCSYKSPHPCLLSASAPAAALSSSES